jgi:hypothetical protein
MKKSPGKLGLNRETLRLLSPDETSGVAGGQESSSSGGTQSPTVTCYTCYTCLIECIP